MEELKWELAMYPRDFYYKIYKEINSKLSRYGERIEVSPWDRVRVARYYGNV
jgi:hypothetical protein